MPSSQLHSQLESFFEDIQALEGLIVPWSEDKTFGLYLRLNDQGYILSSGPELESELGYPPGAFAGRHLSEFFLETESASHLLDHLRTGDRRVELTSVFLTNLGDPIEALIRLDRPAPESDWEGFVRLNLADPAFNGASEESTYDIEPGSPASQDREKPGETSVQPPLEPETQGQKRRRNGSESASGRQDRTRPILRDQNPLAEGKTNGTGPLNPAALEATAVPGTAVEPAILQVPVFIHQGREALLEIVDETPHRDWTEDERRLVEEVAGQLSLALENAELFSQTQLALNETETQAQRLAQLNEMSEMLSRVEDLDEVFRITARKITDIIPADSISMAMLDPSGVHLNVVDLTGNTDSTYEGEPRPILGTSIEDAIREKKLIYNPNHQQSEMGSIGSLMVAPLITTEGVLGTLNVGLEQPNAYRPRDETLLLQIATIIASTIHGRRLFTQTETALAETEALFKATAELNVVQSFDDILTSLRIHTILGKGTQTVALMLLDRPRTPDRAPEWHYPIAVWSRSVIEAEVNRVHLRDWERAGIILRGDSPTIIEDARAYGLDDPFLIEVYPFMREAGSVLFAPLNVGRQWIGNIIATYPSSSLFPDAEVRRLTSVASQAAVAIENIRLLEETRERARQLQTAAEIARDASEALAVDELLSSAVKLLSDRFGFSSVSVYLIDEQENHAIIRASTSNSWEAMKSGAHRFEVGSDTVIGHVTTKGPIVINDTENHPYYLGTPPTPETRSQLALPLKAGDQIIGALDIHSAEVDAFRQDVLPVLQTLADQIAVAVQNARSYELAQNAFEEARQRLSELSMLYTVSQSFSSAPLESEEIAGIIARQFLKVMRVPECSVALLDNESGSLVTVVRMHVDQEGEHLDLSQVGKRISFSDYPLAAQAMREMKPLPILVEPVEKDITLGTASLRLEETRMVIVPMAAKGEPIGIVELKSTGSEKLATTSELNLAMTLANQAAVALENARLYEEQRKSAEQLREVDTLKSQFLANMSHELRTPLNSIIGFSRVILKGIDGPVTKLQEQDLTAIYNAGQHLLSLINNILDLSKVEAGKMEFNIEEVNLAELIDTMMFATAGLIKNKPIQLHKNFDPSVPMIQADPLRIRQVLLNLLSNAAKFTEEGSISVSCRLQDSEGRPEVLISVRDTGPGIAPADLEKLFLPFSQVDASPTRKTGGTGLGLSISKHLIEMHSGHIGVESVQGEGSRFFFTLPIPQGFELGAQASQPVQALPVQRTVLSIDSDPRVVDRYERYLAPEGFLVRSTIDPNGVPELARQISPTAITLDVMVGNGEGWNILKSLKSRPETRDIPVVVCSIVEERSRARELGADGYLVKPILESDLVRMVQTVTTRAASQESVKDKSLHPILIIGAGEAEVETLPRLLEEAGIYQVQTVEGGVQAFESVFATLPEVVLLSHPMPDMDTLTFLQTFQSYPQFDSIPVILLSEDATDEAVELFTPSCKAVFAKNQLSKDDFLAKVQEFTS